MIDTINEHIKQARAEIKEGNWEKAADILAKAIEMHEISDPNDEVNKSISEALRLRSYSNTRMGKIQEAVTDARKAMEISCNIGDLEGEADALRRLGYVHWRKGDHVLAQEFYVNGLEKAGTCGANHLLGKILLESGSLAVSLKEFGNAEMFFKKAIEILTKEGFMEEVARATNNLGSCYMDSGQFDKAIPTFERCVQISEDANDPLHKGWAAFNLADCYTQMGKPEKSLGLLDMALVILNEMNDLIGIVATHMCYGKTFIALEKWNSAEKHAKKALELLEKTSAPPLVAEARYVLGKTYKGIGDTEAAREELTRSYEMYSEIDMVTDANKVKRVLDDL
jgi:tetratricopeptide (TPR) repeat protein